jgi:hypothetical protein
MKIETEGMLLASHCMLFTLVAKLQNVGILASAQILDAVGDAEEYLAGLSPALMSDGAREHAKVVLQKIGRISPS